MTDCTGDSCIYIYVAEGILQGDIPYLDRWDNKGPLFYTLISVGLVIHEAWGVLLMQGLFLLGATFLAFALLRKSFGILPALFALAVFLTYYSRFALPGNFTEQYGLLFQFLTLYLFVRSDEQGKPESSRLHFASAAHRYWSMHKPNIRCPLDSHRLYWLFIRRNSIGKLAWGCCRRWWRADSCSVALPSLGRMGRYGTRSSYTILRISVPRFRKDFE